MLSNVNQSNGNIGKASLLSLYCTEVSFRELMNTKTKIKGYESHQISDPI